MVWPTNSANPKETVLLGLKLCFLLLIMAVGLLFRFDDVKVWEKRHNFFYLDENRPLFTSYDAFYYARLARDYQHGHYRWRGRDPLRGVPDNYLSDNITYPLLPLMSFSTAKISDWFNTTIEKVAFYYTPITAVLFALPLFLYLETLGYTAAGLLGALCGILSFIYFIRTSLMRFDTDSLNLFFPFALAWALTMYFRSRRPLLWAGLASFLSVLFYWWYFKPHFILITFLIFAGIIYFSQRRFTRQDRLALLILFLPNIWYLWQAPLALAKQIWRYVITGVFPTQTGLFADFPNIRLSISELQQTKSLSQMASLTIQNEILFILGLLGSFVLLFRHRKHLAFVWPYFLVGLLVFRSGNRFAMYLAPFIGMGLGYGLHLLFEEVLPRFFRFSLDRYLRELCILLLTALLAFFIIWQQKSVRAFVAVPKINSLVARDMEKLQQLTPPEAWIWSWWDYGYAFEYLADRAVFIDGGELQGKVTTYYVALSFASPSPEEAYHTIAYISREGLTGIEKRLKEEGLSAEELTENIKKGVYYQTLKHPVYWVFTQDLPPKYAWIGFFGTWDFQTRNGHFGFIMDLNPCQRVRANVLACRGSILDFDQGQVKLGTHVYRIKEVLLRTERGFSERSFHPKGLIVQLVDTPYGRLVYLADERSFRSNFNQMYILRNYDARYFELIMDDFPFMVVYRVKSQPEEDKGERR